MIERNRHPAGRLYNMLFGLACIGDGLARLLSGGFLHTRFTVDLSRVQAKRAIQRMKGLKK
jgi:hypothetical protein